MEWQGSMDQKSHRYLHNVISIQLYRHNPPRREQLSCHLEDQRANAGHGVLMANAP
jgi:hypothetical protein